MNQPNQPSYSNPYTKLYCALCYLGILWVIGLIVDRQNPVTRFHVNQGILLTILCAVLGIITGIWHAIFNAIFGVWAAGFWAGVLWPGRILNALFSSVVGIIILVYILIGIAHAVTGKQKPLPIIGKMFVIIR